jgi:endonuclease YncB( thermonuclease family)
MKTFLAILIISAVATFPAAMARGKKADLGGQLAGQVSVIDGDTLELHGRRIRIFGIDAVESSQLCQAKTGKSWRCGAAAANALSGFIASRPVECTPRDRDRYQRIVAKCQVAGMDIGAWLVGSGWALAFRRYSTDYVLAETRAAQGRRGIHDSYFVAPWDYRRDSKGRLQVRPSR